MKFSATWFIWMLIVFAALHMWWHVLSDICNIGSTCGY